MGVHIIIVISAIFSMLSVPILAQESAPRPNIILIVADDLGWNDVGFHGSEIPTPNIDMLAHDGVILNNYYVQPICTPTRSALMTGRYPIHTGMQHDVLNGAQPYGLPLDQRLLSQELKDLDYSTHIVGKWHLGFYANEYTPTYRGFDSHFGYYQGRGDYWHHTYQTPSTGEGFDFHRNMTLARDVLGQYSTELFTDEARRIIQDHNKSKPLFLYLPHQAVHAGPGFNALQVPLKYAERVSFIKDINRRMFAGMVSALDDAVGALFATLKQQGMLDNSIIVFTTDNGGPANNYDGNCACNLPLRGLKHTLWEGGVRGTGWIWSPLLEQYRGRVANQMMHVSDWLPTLLGAVGGRVDPTLDGVNMWDSFLHNLPSPRKEILHNIDPIENYHAIRMEEYKLIVGDWAYGVFDSWYPPVCGQPSDYYSESEENAIDGYPSNIHVMHQEKKQPYYTQRHSQTREILAEMNRNVQPTSPVLVKCGPKPANASMNCRPALAPCLYNIASDPCEYSNVASEYPEVVKKLLDRLAFFNSTAVPPLNVPADPKGYPSNNNFAWQPWVKLSKDESGP